VFGFRLPIALGHDLKKCGFGRLNAAKQPKREPPGSAAARQKGLIRGRLAIA
jgi:hypothetical protein